MAVQTIVFDLGGVLVDWNPRYLYRKIFDSEERMEWFLENVCHQDWNVQQDAGRDFEDGIKELVPKFPELEAEIEAYFLRWEEMLGGAIPGSVQILKEYHHSDSYEIYALTNWSKQTFPIALDQFEFLHWFKGILVSGEEGMKKPDAEIYERLLERYSLEASRSVFIDDSKANVEAAGKLGFKTIHFQSPEQLRSSLNEVLEK